jgi:hypothetical protein
VQLEVGGAAPAPLGLQCRELGGASRYDEDQAGRAGQSPPVDAGGDRGELGGLEPGLGADGGREVGQRGRVPVHLGGDGLGDDRGPLGQGAGQAVLLDLAQRERRQRGAGQPGEGDQHQRQHGTARPDPPGLAGSGTAGHLCDGTPDERPARPVRAGRQPVMTLTAIPTVAVL